MSLNLSANKYYYYYEPTKVFKYVWYFWYLVLRCIAGCQQDPTIHQHAGDVIDTVWVRL